MSENEGHMTMEELEAATNPWAVAADTNGDGEVSKEELDEAVDELAEIEQELLDGFPVQDELEQPVNPDLEDVSSDPKTDTSDDPVIQDFETITEKELSAADLVRMAEANTRSEVDNRGLGAQQPQAVQQVSKPKEKIDTTVKPTLKILKHLMLGAQEKTLHCQSWADNNNSYFLGFCIKSGEPLFKEKSE